MYKIKKKKLEKARGITLIALVITIIVLLILAGVSIAMLTGPNGLLTQADEARTKTDRAGAREKVQLAILGSYGVDGTLEEEKLMTNLKEMPEAKVGEQNIQEENLEIEVDGYTFEITKEGEIQDKVTVTPIPDGDEVIPGVIVKGTNKTYTDIDGDTAVIPVGFAIVPNLNDVSEGLVISDKENDIEDEGNQFVWIPVESADDYKTNITYKYTTISTNTQNDIGYLPIDDDDIGIEGNTDDEEKRQLTLNKETELVTKEGVKGFYISRYEAGQESTDTLVSKKGANVWVSIPQETAKNIAKTFVVEDNTKVKSGLCTGIQWDVVMEFVNEKNDGAEPPQKFDVTQSSSNRHTGSKATSGQNEADKVCNIYDLEGNCYEYVAEKNTYNISDSYVFRGGPNNTGDGYSASYRNSINGDTNSSVSFRFVLYVM